MTIPDSDYVQYQSIESHGTDSYGVKLLIRRPKAAHDRLMAAYYKDWGKRTPDEHKALNSVIGIEAVLRMVQTQDRLLDPEVKKWGLERRAKFSDIFTSARFAPIFIEETPNEYEGESPWAVHNPWYRITTSLGHFKVGWRKSVINLDWKDTILRNDKGRIPSGQELFPDEDVTRYETGIHAWGYEQLAKYLETINMSGMINPNV